MRILLINEENDFQNQIAAAWLQSFNKEMTVVATGLQGKYALDGEAVKVMKEANVELTSKNIGYLEKCSEENWDYVVPINQCTSAHDARFTGNVLQWVDLKLKNYTQQTDDDETIYEYYIRVRDRLRYQMFSFFVTTISGKEMLGADSCGVECDIL